MILKSTRSRSIPAILWWLGAFSIVGAIAFFFWPQDQVEAGDLIATDMERTRGGRFVQNGHSFTGGDAQSDVQARSGRYSSRVAPGEGEQYGPSYSWQEFGAGDHYRVSVWTYHRPGVEARLVVEGNGPDKLYLSGAEFMDLDAKGWRKLQLEFTVPFGKEIEELKTYVYTSGQKEVFFDDYKIEKLDQFAESPFQPATLRLEFSEKALKKLRAKRETALRLGLLESSDDDWVRADLYTSDASEPLRAEVRLKGDWLDHLEGNKWSYRVKLKEGSWRGMTVFSLQTPEARYFLHEWLLHRFFRHIDLLTTRYDFVELQLNGDSGGVYAYEEHFVKQLVESQQRREGPILRFDETGFWRAYKRQLQLSGRSNDLIDQPERRVENAPIRPFGEKKLGENAALQAQFLEAEQLLLAYQNGTRPAAELFDLDRMAAFYAAADLFRAYHGISWHNQRFYFNPVTKRLEPIGFDGYGGPPEQLYSFLGEQTPEELHGHFFTDTAFVARYHRHLYQFTDRQYLIDFFESLAGQWQPRLDFIRQEFADYDFSVERFIEEAQFIRTKILPAGSSALLATRNEFGRLELQNRHTLPVQIIGFGNESGRVFPATDSTMLSGTPPRLYQRHYEQTTLSGPVRTNELALRAIREQRSPQTIAIDAPPAATQILFRVPGIDSTFSSPVRRGLLSYSTPPSLAAKTPQNNDWYRVQGQIVSFRRGRHRIDRDLVFPAGYTLVMGPGTELDLTDGAAFISYSPVELRGESEAPVRILSSDNSAQGFTVLTTGQRSVLSNVHFSGLGTLRRRNWTLTGAVSFHEATVEMRDVTVSNNRSEDALNIIRSEVDIRRLRVQDTPFDGFDCDFCRGTVRDSRFLRTGNDGLDLSGSILRVRNSIFEENGDKALSAGEASDVALIGSSVEGAAIAVASKDNSMVLIEGITLRDSEQGFAAYQKKPEYGPAKIVASGVSAKNVRRLRVAGPGSEIVIE